MCTKNSKGSKMDPSGIPVLTSLLEYTDLIGTVFCSIYDFGKLNAFPWMPSKYNFARLVYTCYKVLLFVIGDFFKQLVNVTTDDDIPLRKPYCSGQIMLLVLRKLFSEL